VPGDEHLLREAFYKAKTINVYFNQKHAGLGLEKLPHEKHPRIINLYLPVPPRPGIPEHILRRALSCKPLPAPGSKFAKVFLALTVFSGILSIIENPYSEIAWFVFLANLTILIQIGVARLRRRHACPRRIAFIPEEYKELVEKAAQIVTACRATGQCRGETTIGGRRLVYAAWKPGTLTSLLGLDNLAVFGDPSSARRRGGGWGGRR